MLVITLALNVYHAVSSALAPCFGLGCSSGPLLWPQLQLQAGIGP